MAGEQPEDGPARTNVWLSRSGLIGAVQATHYVLGRYLDRADRVEGLRRLDTLRRPLPTGATTDLEAASGEQRLASLGHVAGCAPM